MPSQDVNEITQKIIGCAFEVSNTLGIEFVEKVYENALVLELIKRNLSADNQVPIDVKYKGKIVGEYIADIIVENKVILEIKAVKVLNGLHEAQILNYLKATGFTIGLLVNFTHPKAEIKRFVF